MSLAMVGCLFVVFGLVSWVNSILVPYFKVACDLQSGVQTYLVTFAFYIVNTPVRSYEIGIKSVSTVNVEAKS